MAVVKVRVTAKLLRGGIFIHEKKYAISFEAAEDAAVAALVQQLHSKQAFTGLSLNVDGVTVLDEDFDDYFEVESGDRLTDRGTYIVTFIEARNEQVELKERPPSASDDDIVWEPMLKIAAPSNNSERKPELSQGHRLLVASARRSFLFRSAAATPTSKMSIGKASSTRDTDLHNAASLIGGVDDSQSPDDAECVVTKAKKHVTRESKTVAARVDRIQTNANAQRTIPGCSEPLLCKQEDNSASDALAIRACGTLTSAVSHALTDSALSTDANTPPSLAENIEDTASTMAGQTRQQQFTTGAAGAMMASFTEKASPSGGVAADVERQTSITRLVAVKVDNQRENHLENLIVEAATADKENSCNGIA